MAGVYKINMQKSITIMFTNYNQLEDIMREKIPLLITGIKNI